MTVTITLNRETFGKALLEAESSALSASTQAGHAMLRAEHAVKEADRAMAKVQLLKAMFLAACEAT